MDIILNKDTEQAALADNDCAPQSSTRPIARQKGKKTQQAIVTEARRILVDEGYENFVIRKIAKNVGIKPGNLQYYYHTKKDLLWEVLTPEIDKYEETYNDIVLRCTSKSAKILGLVDYLLQDIKVKSTCTIWYTIWALAPHDEEVADIMDRWYQTYIESLAKLLQEAVPEISLQRANHLARIITALIDGLTNQIGYGKPQHDDLFGIENEVRTTILHLFDIK